MRLADSARDQPAVLEAEAEDRDTATPGRQVFASPAFCAISARPEVCRSTIHAARPLGPGDRLLCIECRAGVGPRAGAILENGV
jgi:hypothetical protein